MRVAAKAFSQYPFYIRPFFWNQRRKYGQVLQAALLWARSPKLFMGVATLYGMIDRRSSPIDPALRSLVTVTINISRPSNVRATVSTFTRFDDDATRST